MARSSTTFQKGQSGNPGGRPNVVGVVQELAREKTEEAIQTLTAIMEDENAPAAARVAASNAILDRGYGKPTQAITGEGDDGPLTIQIIRFGDSGDESIEPYSQPTLIQNNR